MHTEHNDIVGTITPGTRAMLIFRRLFWSRDLSVELLPDVYAGNCEGIRVDINYCFGEVIRTAANLLTI